MATILVVDDLAANREVLVGLLRYRGHRLIEAANGSEGLDAIQAERPDLVITDVLMPVMDGYELVRQLRLDRETSRIPVIFYTAHYGEREARELALASGVSWVLTKPIEPVSALEVVDRVLGGDTETGLGPDRFPLPSEFDREHLRLLTDKLSANAEELRSANARLRALVNIGLELASERDAERLLQSVCAAARELFGAGGVTLGIVDRDGRILRKVVTCGAADAAIWPLGEPVSGIFATLLAERRAQRIDPVVRVGRATSEESQPPRLLAPIVSPGHSYGWIDLSASDGHGFSQEDESLLVALAGQVGRIYENGYYFSIAQKRADELEAEIVERERAQQELVKSAERSKEAEREFRTLFAANPLPMWIFDQETLRFLEVNDAAVDRYGYSRDDFLTMTIKDIRPTEDVPRLVDFASQPQSNLQTAGRWRHRLKSGRIIDVEIASHAMEFGNRKGKLVVAQDITERNRAEAALRETEARMAFALRESHTGGWELDLGDLSARRTLEHDRIFGYAELLPEWTYEMFLDHVLPEDRTRVDQLFQEAIAARKDWSFECRIRRIDGEVRWIWGSGGMLREGDEPSGRMAGIVQDVTDRVEAVAGLKAAEERMRFALQSADVGIWDLDYTTGELRWSDIIQAQFGFRPGTFDGTFDAFVDRIHPDDREDVVRTFEGAMKTGDDFTTLMRSRWPDGTIRWLSGAGRILLGDQGQALRGVGISMDVTERRALEEQYNQAQKMEAIGRLAGGVAHDFNNLLTVILGHCELLATDLHSADPLSREVAEIQKAGRSAASLTKQLLSFSRREILELTTIDLKEVLVDLRAMLGRLIGEDVRIEMNISEGTGWVQADRGQIEQILLNLCVNARDAMPRGGVLAISTELVDVTESEAATKRLPIDSGRYVKFSVADTGSGMTPEVMSHLFEPFYTTKERGRGTGLGLATVHGIVARNRGTIEVVSELGRGSVFSVLLPRSEQIRAVEDVVAKHRVQTGGETVLVVEDEESLRALVKKLLERRGYRVLVAANGVEARTKFAEDPAIDVLLTDVVMPGESGPELSSELLSLRPSLRVVYMSGYTEDAAVNRGALDSSVVFLHKPFTSESLTRKIREALDR